MNERFAIGLDYGTNSVRALVVDLADGSEVASATHDYRGGEKGVLLDDRDPNLARQDPAQYVAGYVQAVGEAVRAAGRRKGFRPDRVVGLGVDTTASTPLPVDAEGRALATKRGFGRNLAAQAWLWKDHTATAEAAEITARGERSKAGYLSKCGGIYSSEWYWSKLLHCQRTAPEVFEAAAGWVELCDFVPGFLTGRTAPRELPRSVCAAGHKAMWHESWGGLPKPLLRRIEPALGRFCEAFAKEALTSDRVAGGLTTEMANAVGLPPGLPVAVGSIDAHMGAVGSGVKAGTLVKIIGTSTCDITVWPTDRPLADIPGLCGIVPGSVLPGAYGLEAGQSAVGDIFNWFVRHLAPGDGSGDPHERLSERAAAMQPGESGLLALDWNNGNRTVLVDPLLTGLLIGQTLHTQAAEVYRALIEATAFGALTILDRFEAYGVKVREIVNCGGIAEKNPLVMQIYADVTNRPMKISRSGQSCALGAAIFGAVAGGAFQTVAAAQRRMTGVKDTVYRPRKAAVKVYGELFGLYRALHDAFGTTGYRGSLHRVMKDLIALRDRIRREDT